MVPDPTLYCQLYIVILLIVAHHEPQKASKRGRRRRGGHASARNDMQAGIEQLESNNYDTLHSNVTVEPKAAAVTS